MRGPVVFDDAGEGVVKAEGTPAKLNDDRKTRALLGPEGAPSEARRECRTFREGASPAMLYFVLSNQKRRKARATTD